MQLFARHAVVGNLQQLVQIVLGQSASDGSVKRLNQSRHIGVSVLLQQQQLPQAAGHGISERRIGDRVVKWIAAQVCDVLNEFFWGIGDINRLRADCSAVQEAGAAGVASQQIENKGCTNAHAGCWGGEGKACKALDEGGSEVCRKHAAPQEKVGKAEESSSVSHEQHAGFKQPDSSVRNKPGGGTIGSNSKPVEFHVELGIVQVVFVDEEKKAWRQGEGQV
jgi:hypothetical protein